MRTRRTLFLLTDGARARFVERSSQTGDFATVVEVDRRDRLGVLRAELRASAPGRSVQRRHVSSTSRKNSVLSTSLRSPIHATDSTRSGCTANSAATIALRHHARV